MSKTCCKIVSWVAEEWSSSIPRWSSLLQSHLSHSVGNFHRFSWVLISRKFLSLRSYFRFLYDFSKSLRESEKIHKFKGGNRYWYLRNFENIDSQCCTDREWLVWQRNGHFVMKLITWHFTAYYSLKQLTDRLYSFS